MPLIFDFEYSLFVSYNFNGCYFRFLIISLTGKILVITMSRDMLTSLVRSALFHPMHILYCTKPAHFIQSKDRVSNLNESHC